MNAVSIKEIIKPFIPASVRRSLGGYMVSRKSLKPIAERECPICGHKGWFGRFGRPPRLDAKCPNCGSLERHRLFYLAIERNDIPVSVDNEKDKVLHFAPEQQFESMFRKRYTHYQTADLFADADLKINLEDIDLPDNTYKLIIANHVLEHVDDAKASSELSRILTEDGLLIAMVPIIEGWEKTYENEDVDGEEARQVHFGQEDHVRYYGRDFKDRIQAGGLELVAEVTAEGADVIKYGLIRGQKVFAFRKKT